MAQHTEYFYATRTSNTDFRPLANGGTLSLTQSYSSFVNIRAQLDNGYPWTGVTGATLDAISWHFLCQSTVASGSQINFRHVYVTTANNSRAYQPTSGTGYFTFGTSERTINSDQTSALNAVLTANGETAIDLDYLYASITVTVPSGSTLTIWDWYYAITYTLPDYVLTVTAGTGGTVTGGGTYEVNSTATLTATASAGYHFVSWSDGNTNATRTVTVTGNASYTASFAPDATPHFTGFQIVPNPANAGQGLIITAEITDY